MCTLLYHLMCSMHVRVWLAVHARLSVSFYSSSLLSDAPPADDGPGPVADGDAPAAPPAAADDASGPASPPVPALRCHGDARSWAADFCCHADLTGIYVVIGCIGWPFWMAHTCTCTHTRTRDDYTYTHDVRMYATSFGFHVQHVHMYMHVQCRPLHNNMCVHVHACVYTCY